MPRWGETYKFCDGSTQVSYKPCWDWSGADVNDCQRNAPPGTVGWWGCAIGSSPGGQVPGQQAQSCLIGYSPNFNCLVGQNCFAVTNRTYGAECDTTKYTSAYQGCEGNDRVTYHMCHDWSNNDPRSCERTSRRPANIIGWKKCAIGSSPSGKVPGNRAQACPIPMSPSFNCEKGQNCFAITKKDKDASECLNPIEKGINKVVLFISIGVIVFLFIIFLIISMVFLI